MYNLYFIDQEGQKISDEKMDSHTGLAREIIEANPEMKEEFLKTKDNYDLFLYKNKGYMSVSESEYRNIIVYNSLNISEKQKSLLERFTEAGYEKNDLGDDIRQEQEQILE